ncbi:MAG: hypothetical protein PHN91_00605 [Patescibacteria group bacterium]|nr:hypothetical protein [Patescibacteria group bacterium]
MFKKNFLGESWRWAFLILIVVAAIFVRFLLPSGTWECYNGQWVKRGKPNTPRPTKACLIDKSPLGELIADTELILGNYNSAKNKNDLDSQTVSETEARIILKTPSLEDSVLSPLAVTGLAPDDWFYGGELLVELRDDKQQSLAKHFASKQPLAAAVAGYAPFAALIEFETRAESGYLLIYKNNLTKTDSESLIQEWPISFNQSR